MDALADDRASLHGCVLAGNRALAACAQTILYRDVSLSAVSREAADLHLFSRTLSANCSLGALVKTLRISGSLESHPRYLFDEKPLLTPELLPFSHLPELRILTLGHVRLLGVDGMLAVLAMLPKLERLVCDGLFDQAALDLGTIYEDMETAISSVPPPRDVFPGLKGLRVEYGYWRHPAFANRILFNYPSVIAHLQHLDLSFACIEDTLSWAPVIRAAGATLRSLSITLADHDLLDRWDSTVQAPAAIERNGSS